MVLCEALEHKKIAPRGLGRGRGAKFLKTEYLRDVVKWTYEGSVINWKWGTREVATMKMLSALYGESGFYKDAINKTLNKNGSIDQGIAQRNSMHDESYRVFCINNRLDHNSVKAEIYFASWLNQKYKWDYRFLMPRRKDQAFLYKKLRRDIPLAMGARGY